jgi:hypothetical protein
VIITREEVATRGCPLRVVHRAMTIGEQTAAFAPGQLGNGTISTATVPAFAPCLHEQCMAWRWADAGMDSEKLPDGFRADDRPWGCCGLAGMPLLLR